MICRLIACEKKTFHSPLKEKILNKRRVGFVGLITGSLLLLNAVPLKAELWLRGGYLVHFLSTSSGYNKFLKERYGASSPQLSGMALSTAFKGMGKRWGIGMEFDELTGNINYNTLNGEEQQNKMELQNTMLYLTFFLGKSGNLELDVGYGTNKLSRTFYGYQDASIVTTNIANQVGAQKSSTQGSIQMLQVLYRMMGSKLRKFRFEAGGRYSINKHRIPASDLRPGYTSAGIPTDMDFDLGGLGLIGTLTYRF